MLVLINCLWILTRHPNLNDYSLTESLYREKTLQLGLTSTLKLPQLQNNGILQISISEIKLEVKIPKNDLIVSLHKVWKSRDLTSISRDRLGLLTL